MTGHNKQFTKKKDIAKGDLIIYTVENFIMTPATGYIVEKEFFIGVILSNIVHAKFFSQDGSCYTYGYPIVESNDLPYYKIYSIEKQEVVYVCYDKIKILQKYKT